MAAVAEAIAALTATVTEADALGAAGADDTQVYTLHRTSTGDNGNGGTYSADVKLKVEVTVTQPAQPGKPEGAPK